MSQPAEIFSTQNMHDDDGQVIDALFIETDAPPNLKDATQPIVIPVLAEPKKTTRFLTGDITIPATWTPVLLLPADANRQGVNIKVYSPTSVATDGVRFSDEPGNIYSAGKILHGGSTTFDNHTGPIYYVPCGSAANGAASAPINLCYWSVTL